MPLQELLAEGAGEGLSEMHYAIDAADVSTGYALFCKQSVRASNSDLRRTLFAACFVLLRALELQIPPLLETLMSGACWE